MEITNTQSALADQGLKVLVFGAPGAGKTVLCSTTGDEEHTLILSAEAGLVSIRHHDIDAIAIASMDNIREVYAMLRGKDVWKRTDGELRPVTLHPSKRYTWVCIDSLSELAEICLNEELTRKSNDGKQVHGMQAYGAMAKIMKSIVCRFRDLPATNVYMTAKQERAETDLGTIWAPMLPGRKLASEVAYWFDEVFALRTKTLADGTVTRVLQTFNDGAHDCKDRSGALEPFESCNLQHIAARIAAPLTEQK